MGWRGVHLSLVAALGGVLWVLAGSDPGRDGRGLAAGVEAPAGEIEIVHLGEVPSFAAGVRDAAGDGHLDGLDAATSGRLDGRTADALGTPLGRSAGALRVMRLVVVIAVLLTGARLYGVRPRLRRGDPQAAGWRYWFADPGRLRGPPAI